MKILDCRKVQYQILRALYQLAPFDIKGGLAESKSAFSNEGLSCLIISNKPALLKSLLEDLGQQTLTKDQFEVVVVFDAPGTGIRDLINEHQRCLNIVFHQTERPVRILSNLRNMSVSLAQGEYFLFLDDDTRIFQKDFLELGLSFFKKQACQVLLPQAHALFGIAQSHYDFLDQFSFTNRCSFYHRSVIEDLGGFLKDIQTYEDTELSIRLMMKEWKIIQAEELSYFHPPLYFDSMRKPLAIGQTIFQLRRQYSFPVWLLVYLNALRFLPYVFWPGERLRHWFKISLGVLFFPFTGKSYYY
ncbi:MAG: glycosyltransferase family 2 protein [Candidatus Omnitrophica bacterium]|nr:glycosyltransferase family 2 protein [Candidatus Omnitrophota bacterium]